jgi:pSer/pThr/pTyr-binding forkhead associated (FHA) protein
MKLLFPNGEHAPVVVKDGMTRVGSGAGNDITVVAPGIAHQHCEIECRGESGSIRASAEGNVVVVNGRQIVGDAPIKPGDLVLFAKVGARLVALDRPASTPAPLPAKKADAEDDGRTRVRMALPKYVLRGVSGTTFGKTYPLFGSITVGRHSECDISVPGEEISRHHAKLSVMPDGIAVEDLGSANGTFIAGKRVHQGVLKPGEELRLDTVRFLLVAPGMEVQSAAKTAPTPATAPAGAEAKGSGGTLSIVLALLLLGGAAAAAWYFGLLG